MAVCCAGIILSCAQQGFPPGGPADVTPPEITGTAPLQRATDVSATRSLVFTFSKPMNEESVENNFFLVPIPKVWPSFEWRNGSRELTVHLSRPLDPNVTYVASIGAKAADQRQNSLRQSFLLVFSTGPVLENKRIAGRVLPGNFLDQNPIQVSLIDVVAYRVSQDSVPPDPRNDIPAYMTQTGADGSYELIGLSRGTFRLFAIGDKDGDGFYTENYDLAGVAPHDVTLSESDSLATAPSIMIEMRYSSPIQLTSARAPDNRRVELYFDRDIIPELLNLEIRDLSTHGSYPVHGNARGMVMVSDPQADQKKYEITRLEIEDLFGNGMGKMDPAPFFVGSGYPDTTSLAIIKQIPSFVTQPEEPVILVFNRPLGLAPGLSGILSTENRLSLAVDQTGPDRLTFRPVTQWQSGENTTILFDRDRLTGVAGNRLTGDGAQFTIRVAPADTLAAIAGTVNITGQTHPVRIFAKELGTDEYREAAADSSGNWTTGPILPGRYLMYGLLDSNGNGRADMGSVSPFLFSEQVAANPDTLVLQSRWPLSGIQIEF
jgi:hypothetical protein